MARAEHVGIPVRPIGHAAPRRVTPPEQALINRLARHDFEAPYLTIAEARKALDLDRTDFHALASGLEGRFLTKMVGQRGVKYGLTLPGLLQSARADEVEKIILGALRAIKRHRDLDNHQPIPWGLLRDVSDVSDATRMFARHVLGEAVIFSGVQRAGPALEWLLPRDFDALADLESLRALWTYNSSLRDPDQIARPWPTAPQVRRAEQSSTSVSRVAHRSTEHRTPPRSWPGISTIQISGFRAFRSLSLELPTPSPNAGQWIVVLGENGSGKSCLLQALALAIASQDETAFLAYELHGRGALLRRDSPDARIDVRTVAGHRLAVRFQEEDDSLSTSVQRGLAPFVVGYGTARTGSASDGAPSAGGSVRSLFGGASLVDPETWLVRQRARTSTDSTRRNQFTQILQTVSSLLPEVEAVDLDGDTLIVSHATFGVQPAALLSDGYRTTISWVVDLVARWLAAHEKQVDPRVPIAAQMSGLVLVDELDLHLHPHWQLRVVRDLRTLFPRLSFVVTTHSPLVLRGLRDGELVRLGWTGGSTKSIGGELLSLPTGQAADRVLTGPYFSIPSALCDQETLDMLQEHRRLVASEGVMSERARQLEVELHGRLFQFRGSPLERLAEDAIADALGPEPPLELSLEERDRARAAAAERLRRAGVGRRGRK